ncbi:putative nuclease HARBI1 [Teleopsis dalmanni]|uniref:putative nuclease HARBI1 n=1 Tax=Teleopsis dalmanni TaxID=139649 RepID=UPI0018CCFC56|nr:putative nuclease HARBI1 [Teleopsis dalmanni]
MNIGSDKTLYRFSKENIQWLVDYFLPSTSETRGGGLDGFTKMCTYLRFLADPGFQCGIGEDIGIHQSTASRIIKEMAFIISQRAAEWIKFPETTTEFKAEQTLWSTKYKMPFAVGAIDCTHFKIKKPLNNCDEYICRKGFFSINVQATCNANELFTSVDVSWPSSVHDSRIFKNSSVHNVIKSNDVEAYLLGDEGYGIAPWLMTPFKNPSNPNEALYNSTITKEKTIIERCFGQLKQRFALFQYKIRVDIEIVP